jgi:hypothetical protein
LRSRSDNNDKLLCSKAAAEDHSPAMSKPPVLINEDPVPLRELFVFRIMISIANYWALAFLGIAYATLLPLFYSTPIEYGGLGLPPLMIGLCLGCYQLLNGLFQAFFFTTFIRIWGPKRVFMSSMTAFIPIFAMFPVIQLFARQWGLSAFIWVLVGVQLFLGIIMRMSYSESFSSVNMHILTKPLLFRFHIHLRHIIGT